jgi:hypothetical protein
MDISAGSTGRKQAHTDAVPAIAELIASLENDGTIKRASLKAALQDELAKIAASGMPCNEIVAAEVPHLDVFRGDGC